MEDKTSVFCSLCTLLLYIPLYIHKDAFSVSTKKHYCYLLFKENEKCFIIKSVFHFVYCDLYCTDKELRNRYELMKVLPLMSKVVCFCS